ncbi:chemotaxis protein CheA [Acidihalobacter prosperus]|uniref:Chemotaxis protein CheA n=1 Tax=Acidihalobacter prosperus TaxID=160660 RepID=A0A1A6C5Q8_9GAMM|nr:chemotaxis protein CheA [Acidihalobacter prosperus]OBS09875.1 Signal transduction histidine kinase CheA [Acidihalobacter prosperus]
MSDGFDMSGALGTFLEEAHELLLQMESILLRLEEAEADPEDVNALFRAAHTVKGSAGLFGLDDVVAFGHEMESVLDRARDGALELAPPWVSLLIQCTDHLGTLVDCAAESRPLDDAQQAQGRALIVALRGGESVDAVAGRPPAPADRPAADKPEPQGSSNGQKLISAGDAVESAIQSWTRPPEAEGWHLSLRFGEDTFRNGMDPLSFVRYLKSLGQLVGVELLPERIPEVDYDPECCYMGFEIHFRGDVSKQTLEDVFEFVREDCELRILPMASKAEEFLALIQSLPEDDLRLGEILVKVGTVTQRELTEALAAQAKAENPEPLGHILVEQGAVQSPIVKAALEKQNKIKEVKARDTQSVRVQADKLDALIDLVGELVIASSAMRTLGAANPDAPQQEASIEVGRLVELIREGTLRLRMVEIGETFARFHRIVRDTARELGKEVTLQVEGGETELDRTMVEKLADPLTHMVRNAIDHGIEMPDVRMARGKSGKGTIRLAAFHDSGSVVIEVGDDGAGLDPERIRNKAIGRGLIGEEDQLSTHALYQLIFEPGFSTAEQVSNLSGRGVGMDVVKKTIEGLRGSIDIDSMPGRGTSVRLRLPLTLAIIDGFLLGVGESKFVLPLDMVVECIDFDRVEQRSAHGAYVQVRDEVIPYLRIADFFGLTSRAQGRESLVVVQAGGRRFGLVVDDLLGELQTVIKPLGDLFAHLKGISGSTILGSGELALIFDAVGLSQLAALREGAPGLPRVSATEGEPAGG